MIEKKAKNNLISVSEFSGAKRTTVPCDINAWNETHQKNQPFNMISPPILNRPKSINQNAIQELKKRNLMLCSPQEQRFVEPVSQRLSTKYSQDIRSVGKNSDGSSHQHTPGGGLMEKGSSCGSHRNIFQQKNLQNFVRPFRDTLFDNKENDSLLINLKPCFPPRPPATKPTSTQYQSMSLRCRKKSLSRFTKEQSTRLKNNSFMKVSELQGISPMQKNIRMHLENLEKKERNPMNGHRRLSGTGSQLAEYGFITKIPRIL